MLRDEVNFNSPTIMKRHNEILEQEVGSIGGAEQVVVLITAGGVASRKSYVCRWLQDEGVIHKRFAHLDVDAFRPYLPPWQEADRKMHEQGSIEDRSRIREEAVVQTQREAGELTDLAVLCCVAARKPFIYETTLRDKARFDALCDRLLLYIGAEQRENLHVVIVFVDTPLQDCYDNARRREKVEGRRVHPEFVAKSNKEARETAMAIRKDKRVKAWVHIDNSGGEPRFVDEAMKEELRRLAGPSTWKALETNAAGPSTWKDRHAGGAVMEAEEDSSAVAGLEDVFTDAEAKHYIPTARAWCDDMGVRDLKEIVASQDLDEFLAALNMKKFDKIRLRNAFESKYLSGYNGGAIPVAIPVSPSSQDKTLEIITAFYLGEESADERERKMRESLTSYDEKLSKDQQLLFHYTSLAAADEIRKTGFRPSKFGMKGSGVYFSVNSPVAEGFTHRWPSPEFRLEMLRANYGEAWKQDNRKCSVDVMILFAGHKSHLETVPDRPGAVRISDRAYKFATSKDEIIEVIQLYCS